MFPIAREASGLNRFFWALFIPALLVVVALMVLTALEFDQRVLAQKVSTARLLSDGLAREFSALVSPDNMLTSHQEVQSRIDGVIARFSSFDRIVVLDPHQQILFDTQSAARALRIPHAVLAAQPSWGTGDPGPVEVGSFKILVSAMTASNGQPLGSVLIFVSSAELVDYRWELLAAMAPPSAGLVILTALLCLWPARWLKRHVADQLGGAPRVLYGFVLGDKRQAQATDLQPAPEGQSRRTEIIAGAPTRPARHDSPQAFAEALSDRWQSLNTLQDRIERHVEHPVQP